MCLLLMQGVLQSQKVYNAHVQQKKTFMVCPIPEIPSRLFSLFYPEQCMVYSGIILHKDNFQVNLDQTINMTPTSRLYSLRDLLQTQSLLFLRLTVKPLGPVSKATYSSNHHLKWEKLPVTYTKAVSHCLRLTVFCVLQEQFISKLGENEAISLYQMIFLFKHYFRRTTWQLPCFSLDVSKAHKCLMPNSVCSGTWLHAVFTSCDEYKVETVHRKKCYNL